MPSPVESGSCGFVAWQGKNRRMGTTPFLVVPFAGTVQPGLLDHSTWPVGGLWIVRLERIAFCTISGTAFSALCRSGRTAYLPFSNGPFHWNASAGLASRACPGRAGLSFAAEAGPS